tara:strand:- start:10030 stop:10380 length:351 start_codon:yes stop_codon:yes gene_type:complete
MSTATPTDSPAAPPKKKVPARGTRKRVLGEGEGDYCIYEIAPSDSDLPKGTLLPIPQIPRFENSLKAMTWIRNESGDKLTGKQVMVFAAKEILDIRVASKPVISITTKPKTEVKKG